MSLKTISEEAFVYSVFSRNKGESEATDLAISQLRGSTIAIISGHVPARTCGQVLAWARVQVLQNSGSRMVALRFTTRSARDRH